MNQRGFSVLEMVAAAAVFATIFGPAVIGLVYDQRIKEVLTAELGSQASAQNALDRIGSELRTATMTGEDRNRNGTLDAGEDLNGNGIIDADWDLPDGAESAGLTFNSCRDVRDVMGNLLTVGALSDAIRYELQDGNLVRVVQRWAPTSDSITEIVTVLVNSVENLRFRRAGPLVTITFELRSDGPNPEFSTTACVSN